MNGSRGPKALPRKTAHVWRVSVQVPVEKQSHLIAMLSPEERQALDRIVSPEERSRRLAAWARMRGVLAEYLECRPEEIALVRDRERRPRIADPGGAGLQFSLSHANDHALVGVSRSAIGVDIEKVEDSTPVERLASRFFAPDEAAWLRCLAKEERALAFTRLWVLKEAVLKAVGGGVPSGLSRFLIRLDPLILEEREATETGTSISLFEIEAPAGYCAAVAVTCPNCVVECFDP